MRKLLLILLISFSGICLRAQNLDSLWGVWNDKAQPDTTRLKSMQKIAWDGYLFSQPDSGFYFAQMQYDLAKKSGLKNQMANSLNTQGVSFAIRSDYPKALNHFQRGLKLLEEIGDRKGIASALMNIGNIYMYQGDYPKALDYYQRSLKIYEEISNNNGIANSLGNIGNIYKNQGEYLKALDNYQRCLKIHEEIVDINGIAASLSNIGNIYKKQGDYYKALDYYQRSLKISEEIDHKKGMASSLNDIGSLYHNLGDYQKSINKCSNGLLLAQYIGSVELQRDACQCLYDGYKTSGNGNKALEYHEQMLVLDDSLNAEETAKTLQQMEFSKQVFADSMANVKKERLVQEAHEEEVHKKNRTRNGLIIGGVFFVLLAGGIYSRLRFTKRAKAAVEHEKDRSENLLLNILPADIAEELKTKGKADARDFDMVSILFTDFKGFTSASEKMSAKDLVANINQCFEAYDGICKKFKVEKIKTIGDAYMAAGGLPVPTEDSVKNTVLAALEIQAFITQLHQEKEAKGEHAFEMRVGIHTGAVVAGIVGVKKFQYDIWGDTVNTASRIESNGAVGKVNISQATYDLLKEDTSFAFESRGKIEAKGKGEIEMYFICKNKL